MRNISINNTSKLRNHSIDYTSSIFGNYKRLYIKSKSSYTLNFISDYILDMKESIRDVENTLNGNCVRTRFKSLGW